jgi:hypothetical protein
MSRDTPAMALVTAGEGPFCPLRPSQDSELAAPPRTVTISAQV